ncbi:MAG TPA: hypothetical protein VMH41_12775 [Mycobacteriales bacterium]|nr:hypothetical protein [Mycobacteriales bacterium]
MRPEEMRVVAEFASLAPSVHNTQPWRFVAREDALDVFSDPGRGLDYLDPGHRQLALSCGAAIELARLAIRSLGYGAAVAVRPDRDDVTLLATIETGERRAISPEEQALLDAAARRYTDRGPYTDELPTRAQLQRLQDAAASTGCWLRVLDRPGDRVIAVTLLSEAEAMESHDPAYRTELDRWRRSGSAEDGVPDSAHEPWQPDRVSDVPLRDFGGFDEHRLPDDGVPPAVERDTLILLGTQTDDEHSWLSAGRSLAQVLLTLTDEGLVSQPLGPALDVPAMRARIRHDLGLVGFPQLMLRIGHGTGQPRTGRRPTASTFSVEPS